MNPDVETHIAELIEATYGDNAHSLIVPQTLIDTLYSINKEDENMIPMSFIENVEKSFPYDDKELVYIDMEN
jgi:hypothetical protein